MILNLMRRSNLCLAAILLLTLSPSIGWGAACCGTGASLPNLITGDYKRQTAVTYAVAGVIGDVNRSGSSSFRSDNNVEVGHIYTLHTAVQINPYWQTGFTLPYQFRSRQLGSQQSKSDGLGDVSANLTHEFLPEYTYSVWKPRGFWYVRATAATGRSVYDSRDRTGADIRGKGFHSLGLGIAFTKVINDWDYLAFIEVKNSLPKSFSRNNGDTYTVKPGLGWGSLLGLGYNFGQSWRLGASLAWSYDSPFAFENYQATSSSRQVWDASLQISYLYNLNWMIGASYTDQTIWGPAKNTQLDRTLSLSISYRTPL